MKDTEREEVKKIVDEAMTEKNEKIKKEKKSKKKILVIGGIIIAVLLALATLFFFLFIFKPKYEVTIKTGGGKLIKGIVIEDNVVKEMPEVEAPEGKTLVTWINKNNEAVRAGITLEDDDEWEPLYREPEVETVTLKYETGTEEKIPDIVIPKNSKVVLPYKPNDYKNWEFLYWIDKDGYVVLSDKIITEDTTIYAYWRKPSPKIEMVTIKYETGTSEKIADVKLPKGSKYLFMTPKEPNGNKVFGGWLDDKDELLTNESVVEKDITLKAKWLEYTCPEDCKPLEDDPTKCVKLLTETPKTRKVCPDGTNQLYGYCYDKSKADCGEPRQCAFGQEFGNKEIDVEINGRGCCAPIVQKVEELYCEHEGFEIAEDKCAKDEIMDCPLQ